ncbi:MAG: AsmA family protein, partial [Odoribacter sp.]|nr:AsmA family protein [Odoribacter sp.]
MKKTLLILSIIVIVIISVLFALPVFFKGDILQIIQRQVSDQIEAELKIGDMSLSMFKSFPDLNVSLKNTTITGKQEHSRDTLLHLPLFEASVNLKSLMSGEELIINKILLKDTRLLPSVDTTGKANWDIFPEKEPSDSSESTDPANKETRQTAEKGLAFHHISVENLYIGYNDYNTSTYASIGNLNLQLSGNLSATNTVIHLILALNDISYRQQNTVWVNKTDLHW